MMQTFHRVDFEPHSWTKAELPIHIPIDISFPGLYTNLGAMGPNTKASLHRVAFEWKLVDLSNVDIDMFTMTALDLGRIY